MYEKEGVVQKFMILIPKKIRAKIRNNYLCIRFEIDFIPAQNTITILRIKI